MSDAKKLCLNMIVKNEMANLKRCLSAVADHIDCWVIGDTGSTDGTQDFIRSFFAARNIPGELHSFPFQNFEQARNAALDCAYASPLAYDYLLFDDADMELVVEDRDFRTKLTAPSYTVLQRASISYWNTRLVRRDAGARYRGVTHEYVDVPGGGGEQLHGISYKDHASGSNRVDKYERDIRLLREALKKEPDNSRYWFYLAQSYRDAGQTAKAAEIYAKRAAMGGWDEEAWYARLQQARCLRKLGDDGGFLREALAAFNQRPQRAEPLYDVARYYRDKGSNDASALFAEAGLAIERPNDMLFVEDFVYTTGLKEEYSISANYSRDPARKDRGFAACNWLALNRTIPAEPRNLALSNLHHYLEPATKIMPSFTARPVGFEPPEGYRPTNPSVTRQGDEIVLVQRTVNYTIDHAFPDEDNRRYKTRDGTPFHTRNFLLRLDNGLTIRSQREILPPSDMPEPVWPSVRGFEDARVFAWRDALWCIACVRELTPDGWCEQVLARINENESGPCRLTDWRVLRPEGPRQHEKNWMPRVTDDALEFIYLCDPTRLVDERGKTLTETIPPIQAHLFRGGSQLISFEDGWLALVHEVRVLRDGGQRHYRHRFVWFDQAARLCRVSRSFFFQNRGIEFAAGLAWHTDGRRLMISYGVEDQEARVATVDAEEVWRVLEDAKHLSWGAPPTESSKKVTFAAPLAANEHKKALDEKPIAAGLTDTVKSTQEVFLELAPFLRSADSPAERRERSRDFDARIAPFLSRADGAMLPQIHCFYEALLDKTEHKTLIAATTSMRATGHPVRVWSYTPQKLEFLKPHGIEVRAADDVVPRSLFDRIVARSEIRYFSDVFRYAVLYEHGGLWMDSDVVMLRPFPFRGEYFFNLQWRTGTKPEHYICGNVMYAEPFSHHLRALYETAINRALESRGWEFGVVGPKLLSDYIASNAGAPLRDWVFSPMLFNPIDWTEIDRFDKPISELTDYLNDDRTFGIHLWTARNAARAQDNNAPLVSLLTDPLVSFPTFTNLADRFNTDKNRHTGNRHCYARVYDRLLADRRFSLRRLMEIGQHRGLGHHNHPMMQSTSLWQAYFPFGNVTSIDLTDFSSLNNERFTSFVCDQSKRDDLRAVAAKLEPGSFDVIIDDGSHASFDEQLTLCEFFPLLTDGGWYFLEDLDWQPPGEDPITITLTKNLLREIQQHGSARSIDPLGVSRLAEQMEEILLFDSHYELNRAKLFGGLVAIRKHGGTGFVR
jgi:glycosyltransferase involved in cell wall biosynthesis